MRRWGEWALDGLTALSIFGFAALAWVELATIPNSDVSAYVAWRGQLITADTFGEDGTITVRRVAPWQWKVSPLISYCVMERDGEPPLAGVIPPQEQIGLDSRKNLVEKPPFIPVCDVVGNGKNGSVTTKETVLLRIPCLPWLGLTGFLPTYFLIRRFVS
jgi:hypothetical protein